MAVASTPSPSVFPPRSSLLAADLQARFRPQREWVEGRGRFLIIGHFLSGAGAGAWLLSAFLDGVPGMAVGWVLVALSGLAHLAFLGRPTRFLRMLARPHTSWVSRGLLGMTLFLLTGAGFLGLVFFGQLPAASGGQPGFASLLSSFQGGYLAAWALFWLSLLGAAWVVLYKGFVWASAKGIPLWNTPLLPILYLVYALRGGLAVLLLVALSQPAAGELAAMETLKLWLGLSSALLVLVYVAVMRGTGLTAAQSVRTLLSGRAAAAFYGGVVLLGLVWPIALGAYALFIPSDALILGSVGITSLLGDLALLYAIARAGLYRPLLG
jgi:formate-dependent nitrite reductase membrane component NrfD